MTFKIRVLQIIGLLFLIQLFLPQQSCLAAPSEEELLNARTAGLAYLIQQQNGDGSWGQNENEKVRVTATVLGIFDHYSVSGLVYQRGLNWLANSETTNTEDLARKYQILHYNGIAVETDNLINQGFNNSQDFVWGAKTTYRYSTFDTTEALKTLLDILPSEETEGSISYLMGRRNTATPTDLIGSGWGNSNNENSTRGESRVLPTAQVLLLLHKLGGSYWGGIADQYASHWLALQQHANGAISDSDDQAIIETAFAAQALAVAKDVAGADPSVPSAYDSSLDYLLSNQAADGSVENNLFATAVVMRTLYPEKQIMSDSDLDGIPDSIESIIGTDPLVPDSEYLEIGNGNNTQDTYGNHQFYELVQEMQSVLQLDESDGFLLLDSGTLPPGLTIRDIDNSLTGSPTQLGSYSISYQVISNTGATHHGTALIRIVTADSDTDGDGMSASYENQYSSILSTLDSNDANLDADGDGLTNYMEYVFGFNPTLLDSDGDGINDRDELASVDTDSDNMPDDYEIYYGLDPFFADGDLDLDNDGLSNYEEYLQGLLPNDPDTDNDGLLDGEDPNPHHNSGALIPTLLLLLSEDVVE